MGRYTDLPQLKTVKLGDRSFAIAESFVMANLPSLESIDLGVWCFGDYYDTYNHKFIGGASSFSLTGMTE